MKFREVTQHELLCDNCEKPLGDIYGYPYYELENEAFCSECALKLGYIEPMEYLKLQHPAISDLAIYAEIENEKLYAYIKQGKFFSKIEVDIK